MDADGNLFLLELIVELDALLRDMDITPTFQWVPRSYNELADFWSKFKDPADWSLCPLFFALLEERWGPHTVDRMAAPHNALLPRFYSRFYAPGAIDIDCFSDLDWSRDVNFINPDFNMISRVIDHMKRCRAVGTLIVPEWPSMPWWPLLFPAENEPVHRPVKDMLVLPPRAMRPAHPHTQVEQLSGRVLALRVTLLDSIYCGTIWSDIDKLE